MKPANPNHPEKGSSIKVDPIREVRDIKAIKRLLSDKPRDLALFTVGINTNLRASDLVRVTVGQVRHLKAGEGFEIKEKKTGKARPVQLNAACVDAVRSYLLTRPDALDDEPLFLSQRGGQALTPISINALVKAWCRSINLRGNFGAHTLRKTWGYHQRVTFGTDIPTLMVCFNHSSQRQTLAYLGITPDEVRSVFANVL